MTAEPAGGRCGPSASPNDASIAGTSVMSEWLFFGLESLAV